MLCLLIFKKYLFRKLITCNWERKGNFELSCSIYFYETLFYEISFGTDLNIFSADEKKTIGLLHFIVVPNDGCPLVCLLP